MTEKRRAAQVMRYEREVRKSDERFDDALPMMKSARSHAHHQHPHSLHHHQAEEDECYAPTASSSNCLKNDGGVTEPLCQEEIDVAGDTEEDEIMIADVGTSPIEIANAIRGYNFQSNIDILEFTPALTQQVHSLDVIEVLSTPMHDQTVRDSIAGLCVMVNRLISENRYLLREIQALRSHQMVEHVNRFDSLAFRKRNITREYVYPGDEYGIPEVNFAPIIDRFDLNAVRRNEGAINTVRRFVKFLLENTIPLELQSKFTLRERCGVEHLIECPQELIYMVREICLEAVNLGDVITEEDKEKREDMSDYINGYIKYALQELRRIPRKAKKTAAQMKELENQQQQDGRLRASSVDAPGGDVRRGAAGAPRMAAAARSRKNGNLADENARGN